MTGVEPALILAAFGAVGAAVSAVGTFSAASQAAKGKKFEQQVAERNARAARKQAAIDAEDTRRETRRRLASIKAAYGSKGFTLSGSPLDVLEDQAAEFELAAQRESFSGEMRAVGFTDQAAASRMEARALRTSATVGLIGGAVNVAGAGFSAAAEGGLI